MLRWRIRQLEDNPLKPRQVDLTQVLRFVVDAWGDVTPETIMNCWKKATLMDFEIEVEEPEDISQLQQDILVVQKENVMTVQEYIEIEGEEIVQALPDDLILDDQSDNEDEVQEMPVSKVSSADAYNAIDTLRMFYEQQDIDTTKLVRTVSSLQADHDKLVLELKRKSKQTQMTDYFSPATLLPRT